MTKKPTTELSDQAYQWISEHPLEVEPDDLRWRVDHSLLDFETTDDVDPAREVIGQETAREALLFGLQCDAPGQNIYVRGPRGTGRLKMVTRMLEELSPKTDKKRDYCYVHDFKRPDRPRLLTLPAGTAKKFCKRVAELAEFVQQGLIKSLDSEPYVSQRAELKEKFQNKMQAISEPLEKDLAENNMALVSMQQGPMTVPMIFPVIDDQPIPPDQYRELIKQGKASQEQLDLFKQKFPEFQKRLKEIGKLVNEAFQEGAETINEFNEQAARELLQDMASEIVCRFDGRGVKEFIGEIVDDAAENRLEPSEDGPNLTELYGVNVVLSNDDTTSRPVVEERTPNMMNLLGTVDPKWGQGGLAVSDYRGIRAGALLHADQGYLILNVEDLINEPGAWRALTRTLRTRRLEIVPPEVGWMRPYVVVQPEPIEIKVRVILIGDILTYYMLDRYDTDFRELFKVLADFDDQLPRDAGGLSRYAAVISHVAKEESLPPFHRSAVAALAEHGARIIARKGKMSARFGRIADIAREAAYLAQQDQQRLVVDQHIYEAVTRTKQRAIMPSRRFQELVESKTILVETTGQVVGQINGLAVMYAGPLTYGFPARITATIGPGRAGLINIEGTAQMSGSIHTKGFHILGGLLRNLLNLTHPLAFSASIAFEQSYGGIDGDSASGAEIICLLSALTGIPVRQNMAMTGAIDQHGHVEAIGGVNEKIEGFYDACKYFGLSGDQGVIIPHSNAGDLMLRRDVVEACREGKFHVYAVSTIQEAIELMTGVPAGELVDGQYAEETVLHKAVTKAHEFWRRTLSSPEKLTSVARNDEPVQPPELPGIPVTEPDDKPGPL